ncbi:hypothetical protein [Allopontixanthobacter sediminis]|uniref:Uncharacterized protein n=1 Tax=Allopontixanthobacter sediminis TaxID=1689985 RepID=A0A845AUJ6_9SPHN|nr:hypothetical protein [Allopontixanthobacter sediminis]MXP43213.1 hypothetical protein [Allopontixanthobacter sediminis]
MSGAAIKSRPRRASVARVLAVPAVLLVASIAGLVLGLTGDGFPDGLAWGLLSIPILAAVYAFARRG